MKLKKTMLATLAVLATTGAATAQGMEGHQFGYNPMIAVNTSSGSVDSEVRVERRPVHGALRAGDELNDQVTIYPSTPKGLSNSNSPR